MSLTAPDILTAPALRSRGLGTVACAIFGGFWSTTAVSTAAIRFEVMAYGLIALITASLLIAAFQMMRRSRHMTALSDTASPSQRRTRWIFFGIFAAEIVALNIIASVLESHHLLMYLMAAIAIIVGLHFYPLARLFRATRYYATATVMTMAGVAAIVALAGGLAANPVNVAVEVICALTLWVTGFISWRSVVQGNAD